MTIVDQWKKAADCGNLVPIRTLDLNLARGRNDIRFSSRCRWVFTRRPRRTIPPCCAAMYGPLVLAGLGKKDLSKDDIYGPLRS